MKLLYPVSRRHMAFNWCVESLYEHNEKVYMWTFTWVKPHDDDAYGKLWDGFRNGLKYNFPLLLGLRVFEMHPGSWRTFGESHGLHVHALFNQRVNIHRVQKIANRWGIGRISVRRVPIEEALYIAKYLTKKAERPLPKGMRAFGTISSFRRENFFTTVRQVKVHTQFGENVATWQHRLGIKRMTPDFIHTIYMNSKLYGAIENWPINRLHYWGENARKAICPLTLPKGKAKGMEEIAKDWKYLSYRRKEQRGTISPPEAKKIFTKNTVSEQDTRLDIGADYWDKFPGKTDGTRLAYYRHGK